MALRPYQQPHPPLWIAAHSHGAAARAGQLGDGLIIGPQVSHQDAQALVQTFRQTWQQGHSAPPSRVGAWRPILIGANPHAAVELPLRMVIWEDNEGHTRLDYRDVSQTLGPLYGIDAEVLAPLQRVVGLLQAAVQ